MNDKYDKYKRNFKGIWFSTDLWFCKKLNIIEKFLFAEINSLDNGVGCKVSNSYLALFVGVTPNKISTLISKLKELNLIKEINICKDKRKRILKSFPENLSKISDEIFTLESKIVSTNNNTSSEQITIPPWHKCQLYNKEYILDYIKINKKEIKKEILEALDLKEKIKKKKYIKQYDKNSIPYKLAKLLYEKISELDPRIKTPDLNKWAAIFQTMIFCDGKKPEEIEETIGWIFSESDFWQDWITDAYKLKLKYNTIQRQRNSKSTKYKKDNQNEFVKVRKKIEEKKDYHPF